jgi:hypothetical protein
MITAPADRGTGQDAPAALSARLAEWIAAEGIKSRYPADVLAGYLVQSLGGQYVAERLASGNTVFLRASAENHAEDADLSLEQWAAEEARDGHLAEDMRRSAA